MNPQPISPSTRLRLDILFAPADRAEAERLLVNQCGNNLPFLDKSDEHQLERFRFAAMKLSQGQLDGLRRAIALAKTDWRDLLMAAGFGEDISAHERWWPTAGAR